MFNIMMATPKVHAGSSFSHRALWPSASPTVEQICAGGVSHAHHMNAQG